MCGRYASFREAQALADAFDVDEMTDAARAIAASWNVAPTDRVRIVVEHADHRSLQSARWGLVPPWAQSPAIGARMINARAETLADKPAFRSPTAKRRCLVLADGYYEWHRYSPAGRPGAKERRQPYYIHLPNQADAGGLAFAGLYSWWPDPERDPDDPDRWLLSTTIVTGAARGQLEAIHHREPIVLDAAAARDWLDPGLTNPREATEILREPAPRLTWHPVTTAVGAVANNHPGLLAPVAAPPELAGLLPQGDDAARPGPDVAGPAGP